MKAKDMSICQIEGKEYYSVGWIDGHKDFPTQDIDSEFLDKLFILCKNNVMERYRSNTPCILCYPTMDAIRKAVFETNDGIDIYAHHSVTQEKLLLGTSTIAIELNGSSYFFPDLLWHYIKEHSYAPPKPFVDLVNSFTPKQVN